MNRRDFLKISAITAGVVTIGGCTYLMTRNSDVLDDHYEGTQTALTALYGADHAAALTQNIRREYASLAPQMPNIGGDENIFTEWLIFGVYYLAVYSALKASEGLSVDEVGKIIYDGFYAMADYPKWMLRIVGSLKYSNRYVKRLREAATETQKRRYPGDWVATFIDGDGEEFDYGVDITECGICKFYRAQGAEELAPYMCLSDYVVSEAFDRGLVRYKTIAEGADVCDFRYKKGRATYVHPLRDGWPPSFFAQS